MRWIGVIGLFVFGSVQLLGCTSARVTSPTAVVPPSVAMAPATPPPAEGAAIVVEAGAPLHIVTRSLGQPPPWPGTVSPLAIIPFKASAPVWVDWKKRCEKPLQSPTNCVKWNLRNRVSIPTRRFPLLCPSGLRGPETSLQSERLTPFIRGFRRGRVRAFGPIIFVNSLFKRGASACVSQCNPMRSNHRVTESTEKFTKEKSKGYPSVLGQSEAA